MKDGTGDGVDIECLLEDDEDSPCCALLFEKESEFGIRVDVRDPFGARNLLNPLDGDNAEKR